MIIVQHIGHDRPVSQSLTLARVEDEDANIIITFYSCGTCGSQPTLSVTKLLLLIDIHTHGDQQIDERS